jgi:hypothetical protein
MERLAGRHPVRGFGAGQCRCQQLADDHQKQSCGQMWNCNDTPAQIFVYDDQSQTLTIGAICVESWGRGDSQDAVGLGPSNGGAKQHWRAAASSIYYQIIGVNGPCLDVGMGRGTMARH